MSVLIYRIQIALLIVVLLIDRQIQDQHIALNSLNQYRPEVARYTMEYLFKGINVGYLGIL